MRKSYSSEFKLKAASMVLDEGQPVTEVCASLDIGPTALRQLDVRFAKQVWPGETLTSTATVSSLSTDEVSGEGRVDLTLSVVNADGEEKLSGTATVAIAQ